MAANYIDKSYPIFVLAGCIFDFDDYSKKIEPAINELKLRHFGKTDLILRSYDIRKQKGSFASLVDNKKRTLFYDDLENVLDGLEFTVVAAAINKLAFIKQYTDPANPYGLCFQFIIERAVMFLGASAEQMILRAESRESHNDKQLAMVYENIRAHGSTTYIKAEEVQRKLVDLSFNQKSQNIAGHQISDLVAYPIGRWVLDQTKENKAFVVVERKLHKKNGFFMNCGLKVFP